MVIHCLQFLLSLQWWKDKDMGPCFCGLQSYIINYQHCLLIAPCLTSFPSWFLTLGSTDSCIQAHSCGRWWCWQARFCTAFFDGWEEIRGNARSRSPAALVPYQPRSDQIQLLGYCRSGEVWWPSWWVLHSRPMRDYHVRCHIPYHLQERSELASWFDPRLWEYPDCSLWKQGWEKGSEGQGEDAYLSSKEECSVL